VTGVGERQFVDVRRDGAVCILTLARERKLNALSTAVEAQLKEALEQDEVRTSSAVVLAGRGRAFSAGADLAELAERTPEAILAYYAATGDVYERVASLPQPTLTAIHGFCLGAGLELALATDFRIADESAVLGFPEVELGIVPSSGGTQRAARILGPARAKEVVLLRPRISAAEASALGLVTEVVAEGTALSRALELAQRLAAQPRLAASVAKQAIDASSESPREVGLLIERLAYAMLAQTEDARNAEPRFGSGGPAASD
jgi:enoyl-CoA hydratase/carnithine racemase